MHPALVPWALSGGAAVAVGFARFGYALILPAMQTDLALNYAQAGWLNTSNALGYLLGSLLTIFYVSRIGNKRLFVGGLLLTTIALLACGLTQQFYLLNLFRFLTGLGAAGTFICGGVLASMLGTRSIVIYFAGGGMGMLITGAGLPWLFHYAGPAAWPWAWIAVAAVCTPISAAAIAAQRYSGEPITPGGTSTSWPWTRCKQAFIAYFLFGLGYIAYMTFIVAWLQEHKIADGLSMAAITSVMWSLLGLASLCAPLLWKGIFNGRKDGIPMTASMMALGTGAALPLIFPTLAGVWLSATLVGASVLMVPSAVTGFVKTNLPQGAWGSALAVATSLFALGQTIGPVAAGWVSDLTGSLSSGLAISAAILIGGALLAYTQKVIPTQSSH